MIIKKSSIVLLFILMAMIFNQFMGLSFYRIWFYLAFLIALVISFKYKKIYSHIIGVILIQSVYYIFQGYSTMIAGGDVSVDVYLFRIFAVTMITFMCLIAVYQEEVLRVLNRSFIICYTINIFTIINRMIECKTLFLSAQEEYFMGYRYIFCAFAVVSLAVAYYCQRFSKQEEILYKYLLGCLYFTALTAGPSTLLGGLLVYSAILLSVKKTFTIRSFEIKLNAIILVIGSLVVDVGIVFFNIQEIFAFIIEGILNRELTFTGRSIIWETSIEAFLEGDFWYGLGNSLSFGYNGWGNLGWEEEKYSAHNHILTVLTNTGVIGIIIELVFFIIILRYILKIRERELKYALSSCFISMIIMSISTQLIPFRFIEIFAIVVIFIARKDKEKGEIIEDEYYSC